MRRGKESDKKKCTYDNVTNVSEDKNESQKEAESSRNHQQTNKMKVPVVALANEDLKTSKKG